MQYSVKYGWIDIVDSTHFSCVKECKNFKYIRLKYCNVLEHISYTHIITFLPCLYFERKSDGRRFEAAGPVMVFWFFFSPTFQTY